MICKLRLVLSQVFAANILSDQQMQLQRAEWAASLNIKKNIMLLADNYYKFQT